MVKHRVFVFGLAVFFGHCPSGVAEIMPVDMAVPLVFEERNVLGAAAVNGDEPMFALPRHVAVLESGDVVVADEINLVLHRYTKDGRHVATLGGRGREDGEFIHISAVHPTRDGGIAVYDEVAQRATVFSVAGVPVRIADTGRSTYTITRHTSAAVTDGLAVLTMAQRHDAAPGLRLVVRQFSPNYVDVLDSLVVLLDHDFGELATAVLLDRPGYVSVSSDSTLLYVPHIYEGTSYKFERVAGRWRQSALFVAPLSVSSVLDSTEQKPSGRLVRYSGAHNAAGVLNSEAAGIYEICGKVLTFSAVRTRRNGEIRYDVFDYHSGSHMGQGTLAILPPEAMETSFSPVWVAAADDDQVYVVERTKKPVVRTYTISKTEGGFCSTHSGRIEYQAG